MYSTVYHSGFDACSKAVSSLPDGPNSGYLVIQDEDWTPPIPSYRKSVDILPFPQNRQLYYSYDYEGTLPFFFIPVLNQPVSSNHYYVIEAKGDNIGEALTCSTEKKQAPSCFRTYISNAESRPLNPEDIYQQLELSEERGEILVKSMAPDGFPPSIIQPAKNRFIRCYRNIHYRLEEASGINSKLRSQLPRFDFPLSYEASEPVVVGKWYTPFVLSRRGR